MSVFIQRSDETILEKLESRFEKSNDINSEQRRWITILLSKGMVYSKAKRVVKSIACLNTFLSKPYRFINPIEGFDFEDADRLANETPVDDKERLMYLTLDAINRVCKSGSHMYAEPWSVAKMVKRLAVRGVPSTYNMYKSADILDAAEFIRIVRGRKRQYWYPVDLHMYEDVIAKHLKKFRDKSNVGDVHSRVMGIADRIGISPSDSQMNAILSCIKSPVSVLTGLPGTGKSTVSRVIVEHAKSLGLNCLLLAPTGIAAKRLSSVCLEPAHTCHRAIYSQLGRSYDGPFNNIDLLLIDEVSMLDAETLSQVLILTRSYPQLVFVGDDNQLPSVGCGEVLYQIQKSNSIAVSRLTEIFRSAGTINKNAHRVNSGKMPETEDGIFDIHENGNIDDIISEYDPSRVQILSPAWNGELGVNAINHRVRTAPDGWMNPMTKKFFGIDDKVLITKNDYELGVVNGDQGFITDITDSSVSIFLNGDTEVAVSKEFAIESMIHGYCTTVHKSQGMEYEHVILCWPGERWSMHRELFYTAITRAKKRVSIFGKIKDIEKSISNQKRGRRNSFLWRKIQIA